MRGIVVCVDFDDLLSITLHRNMRHFEECVVVTSLEDERTYELASSIPNVRVHRTNAFYADGAKFNKGRAMEEGFDVLGREGWILVFDADIVLPEHIGDLFPGDALDKDCLYNAERHVLDNPTTWNGAWDWSHIPIDIEVEHPGFFQLFHAEAASLAGKRPWYGIDWTHAGGCDHQFEEQFPEDRRIKRRDIQVLHLGPRDTNWWGRVTPRLDGSVHPEAAQHRDDMERLLRAKGWRRKKTNEAVIERIAIGGEAPAEAKSFGTAR